MIEGTAPEVITTHSTAHTTVCRRGTSARSRPSTHCTDEAEKVDGGVMGEGPPSPELEDRLGDAIHT